MDDIEIHTMDIAFNLVTIAEALAPHLAAAGDHEARRALARRLDEALTVEWGVLETADALDGLHFGTAMAIFGAERLGR